MTDRVRNVKNERVPAILDSAEMEFSQKGYNGTSIQAVADRAGLTKWQVIHYFKTKEKLYCEVIERIYKEWGFFDLQAKEGDPRQIFSDYIEHGLRHSRYKPHRSNLIVAEMIQGAPVILRMLREEKAYKISEQFGKRFEQWVEANKAPKIDPHCYVYLFWAAFSFYAAFAPEVALLNKRKKLTDSDWSRIITQTKRILLAVFDAPEIETQ